ncbi:tropomyosin-1 isoform X10 [Aplysia californica]|uniref:Tropomyosin-1 isoform X10 n=1 Tax=Aplysia californica TaxID=6500 RepID=A0ABM1W524_APLCA|nr:tropomyosin-1 isoform X10 [Aplysia californica]
MDNRGYSEPDDADSSHLSQDSQTSAVGYHLSQGSADGETSAACPPTTHSRHSDKKKKKKSKREKSSGSRHTDGLGNDGSEAVDCDANSTSKRKKSSKTSVKGDKSEKKVKKQSSRRPEPEGGNPLQPNDSSALEYDRIINSTDPLFSDLELDVSGDDSTKQPQRRPPRSSRHSRGALSGGIFIPCTQLGINSNTMIKFAIIGTELQNIFQVSQRLESETAGLQRRIQLLEEDLERSEERLQSATEKLEEASKAADESERQRRSVENKWVTGDKRLEEVETCYRQATQVASEAEARYDEAARKLAITEVDLERAEARLEAAEAKLYELDEELHIVGNNIKTLSIQNDQASQREDSYEETIRDLTQRLKDAENRATEAERTVSKLQKEVDRLEDDLEQARDQNTQLRMEMDQCIGELENL